MSQEQLQKLMMQVQELSHEEKLYLINYLSVEVRKAKKESAIMRIRKRWEMLPIQALSQVQEWKEEGRP